MTTKHCACCGMHFMPRPQVPNQTYCSAPECQRARKRQWQRVKLQSDSDYRINQRASQQAWSQRNQEYWRNYRANRPEYELRNRERQRLRDANNLLLLAATTRPPRKVESIARRSGLTMMEVSKLGARLRQFHWITPEWRPTDAGLRQLKHARNVARRSQRRQQTADPQDKPEYYPQSLRAPVTRI